ncbi:hypothetical protein [Streptomyces triticiradicis]|uniref:Uncharacterized protein n=1 Tax=Streptomyces triticiradicis TaxID=2651189 RepID=A0A7J5DME7_9ACTN|nr:hypothetical protein [Streptomyces triticiradicis]KAB1989903.1 hypothetical protein F8144_06070 [Streptomyces triticiradicis]
MTSYLLRGPGFGLENHLRRVIDAVVRAERATSYLDVVARTPLCRQVAGVDPRAQIDSNLHVRGTARDRADRSMVEYPLFPSPLDALRPRAGQAVVTPRDPS